MRSWNWKRVVSFSIDDEKKQTQSLMTMWKTHDFVTANSLLYPFEDAITSDVKWKGFEGVMSDTFDADSAKIENVIATVDAIHK